MARTSSTKYDGLDIQFYQDKRSEKWGWRLVADNNEIVVDTPSRERYDSKRNAREGFWKMFYGLADLNESGILFKKVNKAYRNPR